MTELEVTFQGQNGRQRFRHSPLFPRLCNERLFGFPRLARAGKYNYQGRRETEKKKRRGIEGGRKTGPSSAVCLWNEADDDNNNDEASCLDFQGLVFSAPWSRRSSASSVSARLLL